MSEEVLISSSFGQKFVTIESFCDTNKKGIMGDDLVRQGQRMMGHNVL